MKKIMAMVLVFVMVIAIGCSNGSNDSSTSTSESAGDKTQGDDSSVDDKEASNETSSDATSVEGTKITFLNTKGEIQAQLEEAAKTFQADTGIELEIIPTGAGESPFEKMTTLYNSGNAPTISMMDVGDLSSFEENMLDLSNEKWVDDAMDGSLDVARINGKLLAFPFAVEGFGLIYNQNAVEQATGESFDPSSIQSKEDLETLFKSIQDGGTAPIVISPLDWSLGAHYTQIAFAETGGDTDGQNAIMDELRNGTLSFSDFETFNALMDTFDMMATYNIDKDDPLSGTYDSGAEAVATGKAAFWFMGNWAWPQINELRNEGDNFGFIPVPLDNVEMQKISVGPTKYVAIDASQSSEAQQQAALTFLNWLVYEENGQSALVDEFSLIPAFTNIGRVPNDPLAESILGYIEKDAYYPMVLTFPSDYWSEVGAFFQEYMAGYSTRDEFYEKMEGYWKSNK